MIITILRKIYLQSDGMLDIVDRSLLKCYGMDYGGSGGPNAKMIAAIRSDHEFIFYLISSPSFSTWNVSIS